MLFGLPIRDRRPLAGGEIRDLLASLASRPAGVALLGDGGLSPRGRYSIFGEPARTQLLGLAPGAVRSAFDDRPRNELRVVFLGYELGRPLLHLTPASSPRGQPLGLAIDLAGAVIVDHERRELLAVGDATTSAALLERRSSAALPEHPGTIELLPAVDDATHAQRLERVLEHIAAGDIYQANLTRRLRVEGALDGPAAALALIRRNPVAHGAWLRLAGFELVSNSMETLLTFDPVSGVARSLPIKGTRARGPDARSDAALSQALADDPKERAEHVMIVDLVRHDLGRVSRPGGVSVPRLCGLEGFHGVWHCVSTVEGRLAEEATVGTLVEAAFPGGSVTGAPKRRAVELLAGLENEPRGAYTGSLAVVGADGTLSASLLIRTLVRDDEGWSLNVGGGIVADSRAEREIAETWEKVRVFRDVLGG